MNVTNDDLKLLSARKVPDGPFFLYSTERRENPKIPQQDYYDMVMKMVKQKAAADATATASSSGLKVTITNITDKDVHDGKIFVQGNNNNAIISKNAYDVLFLFHQEYATQQEYDNLEKFVVQNGGTIVFDDSNILTTEVKYDNATNTITLVRGHTWQFNGMSAWRVERER